jgi:hypothetical protein
MGNRYHDRDAKGHTISARLSYDHYSFIAVDSRLSKELTSSEWRVTSD